MQKEYLEFLCEVIRFKKTLEKQFQKGVGLTPLQLKRVEMAYSRIDKKIRSYCDFLQIEILDCEGMDYDIGLPVDPLNLEDFNEGTELFIETVLEPIIKVKGQSTVIRNGKVILGIRGE